MESKTIACPLCYKAGFVRIETVIARGQTTREFYCGSCGHKWQEQEDDDVPPRPPEDIYDRSR